MKAHKIYAVSRIALVTFFALGLLSSAQGKGVVWVSDSFGQSGDQVGQFADRGEGKWDQVLKNRKRLHSYRQTAVTDQYVELNGSGGVVRLYADQARTQRGSRWNQLATGSFRGGSPLSATVDPVPPAGGAVDTRGIVWASSSMGQAGDRIGGFLSLGDGTWDQVMINGRKVHAYRQTGITQEYVELSGSGGDIRLYGDKALMKRGGNWAPWTYGNFRTDIRIPLPEPTPVTTVPSPQPPGVTPPPAGGGTDVGHAGILWVPEAFGRASERFGQFVGRGDGKWDQLRKNGARVGSYRESSVNSEYVELSGSGDVVRLYADKALMESGGNRRTWTYGSFQNGNPLQGQTSNSRHGWRR